MGLAIVQEFEGRYKNGKLQVYFLPAGDGGGSYEIAGINDRYHPSKAEQLKTFIDLGQHKAAEKEAAAYIIEYTNPVLKFFPSPELAEANPDVEFILRDCAFNRGAKGAATILQLALGVPVDGIVGSYTKQAFGIALSGPFVGELTKARRTYEQTSYPWKKSTRQPGNKFWPGLENRWVKAETVSKTLLA